MSIFIYKSRFKAGAFVVAVSSLALGSIGLISSALFDVDGFVYGAIWIGWFGFGFGGLFFVEIIYFPRRNHSRPQGSSTTTSGGSSEVSA